MKLSPKESKMRDKTVNGRQVMSAWQCKEERGERPPREPRVRKTINGSVLRRVGGELGDACHDASHCPDYMDLRPPKNQRLSSSHRRVRGQNYIGSIDNQITAEA